MNVTQQQAREALDFFAPKGVIYTAARAGWVAAHRETLERFIAAHPYTIGAAVVALEDAAALLKTCATFHDLSGSSLNGVSLPDAISEWLARVEGEPRPTTPAEGEKS
jgi:hypothetical protein